MVMKMLTADDWPPLMQETYYATDNSILTLLYFVIVVVLGMYIIMTLFIAILLERFAGQDDAKFELEDLADKVCAVRCALCRCCCECGVGLVGGSLRLNNCVAVCLYQYRHTLQPGIITDEERDALVERLAREKMQLEQARKKEKMLAVLKRAEASVGLTILSFGPHVHHHLVVRVQQAYISTCRACHCCARVSCYIHTHRLRCAKANRWATLSQATVSVNSSSRWSPTRCSTPWSWALF